MATGEGPGDRASAPRSVEGTLPRFPQETAQHTQTPADYAVRQGTA